MRVNLWWVVLGFVSGFFFAVWAQELGLETRNAELHISAPRLHFLTGPPLQRLKNGVAVPFDFQLSLWTGDRAHLYDRAVQRFVVSYDLWEEKFSVVRQRGFSVRGGSRTFEARRSASGLAADAAEAWCIDSMALPVAGLRRDQPIWVKLEIRSADPKDGAPILGESGLSLNSLVEWFSRPARGSEQRWSVEAGPVRLADVKTVSGRGS